MSRLLHMPKKEIEEFACNPIGKARIMAEVMTSDTNLQCKLHSAITTELSGEEINQLWEEIMIKNRQLKLDL